MLQSIYFGVCAGLRKSLPAFINYFFAHTFGKVSSLANRIRLLRPENHGIGLILVADGEVRVLSVSN